MTTTQVTSAPSKDLERRVCGEYREMPGHRLTLPQACRLWGTDARTSARVLNRLVESGFLRRVGPYYFRADLGHLSASARPAGTPRRGGVSREPERHDGAAAVWTGQRD